MALPSPKWANQEANVGGNSLWTQLVKISTRDGCVVERRKDEGSKEERLEQHSAGFPGSEEQLRLERREGERSDPEEAREKRDRARGL